MSGAQKTGSGTQSLYDFDWRYTVHLADGPAEFRLKTWAGPAKNPTIDDLVAGLITTDTLPDSRATWHHNFTPLQLWVKAHILREARGFTIEGVADYLAENRELAFDMGFIDDGPVRVPDPPGYTQLRDIWEEEFSDRLQASCTILAERLVELARDRGIPAPDKTFVPEDDVEPEEIDEDDPTIRELTTEKTVGVWREAKPVVLNHWYLKRHHNIQIPDATFYDAQAAMGTGDDVFPETGLGNLEVMGNHDRVHYPSTHRRELKRFDIDEIRELHRSVTEDLIKKARSNGELVGELTAAIDVTKGHPWTGERDENDDGDCIEPWILGYKNDNDKRAQYYFQWASIQIVGLDIPLVLDAVPVRRGMTRKDIVDELLTHATEMVDDIELVMMDREFYPDAVKNVCEKHGVYYLNPKVRNDTDYQRAAKIKKEFEENGTPPVKFYEEEDRINVSNRKTFYVPKIGDDDYDEEEAEEEDDGRRQQMLDELGLSEEDMPESDGKGPLSNLLDDIREEEEEEEEDDDRDGSGFIPFETNHPDADPRTDGGEKLSRKDQVHVAARMVRWYGNRWGIENGYKKVKQFLPRTASKDEVLRFFNFAFAATLYNCWRLVDLLVKRSVEEDPDYVPLVTAQRFREVAKKFFGLQGLPPPNW